MLFIGGLMHNVNCHLQMPVAHASFCLLWIFCVVCRLLRIVLRQSHCTMLLHCCCIMVLLISTYSMPMYVLCMCYV